jgi:hypothetical protein
MHRYKQLISLGIVFLGSMNFLDVAQAEDPYLTQPPLDPFFWQKPEQIRPDLYPEQAREGRSDDVPLQYGAISRSYSTGRYGWVWGYDDYEAAENAADQECGVSDCSSNFFGNAFGAIAQGSATSFFGNGDTPESYFEKGDTPEQAAQDALKDCQDYSDILDIPDTCEVVLVVGSQKGTIFQK